MAHFLPTVLTYFALFFFCNFILACTRVQEGRAKVSQVWGEASPQIGPFNYVPLWNENIQMIISQNINPNDILSINPSLCLMQWLEEMIFWERKNYADAPMWCLECKLRILSCMGLLCSCRSPRPKLRNRQNKRKKKCERWRRKFFKVCFQLVIFLTAQIAQWGVKGKKIEQ